MVRAVQKKLSVSERSACRATSQPRSTQRYKAQQRNGEKKLIERMRELALRHPRYGYRRIGSPWENGYAESYHARLRDELLDREEFGTLLQARGMLGIWREQYNNERPHSALGYMTPAGFAQRCRGAGPGSAALRLCQHREEEKPGVSVAL